MDDRLRETLSAMMDDQADELAVRRVLSHDDQEAVHRQWQRWQQIRDVMQDAPYTGTTVDVREAVRQSLHGESGQDSDQTPVSRVRARWRWSAVAMISLGVLVGFGAGSGWDTMTTPHGDGLVTVRTGGPADGMANVPEVALQGLDERQWEQLSRYLLEHAQNNSVGSGQGAVGYARVTSVSGSGY